MGKRIETEIYRLNRIRQAQKGKHVSCFSYADPEFQIYTRHAGKKTAGEEEGGSENGAKDKRQWEGQPSHCCVQCPNETLTRDNEHTEMAF